MGCGSQYPKGPHLPEQLLDRLLRVQTTPIQKFSDVVFCWGFCGLHPLRPFGNRRRALSCHASILVARDL